jgi:hypothetical protein
MFALLLDKFKLLLAQEFAESITKKIVVTTVMAFISNLPASHLSAPS